MFTVSLVLLAELAQPAKDNKSVKIIAIDKILFFILKCPFLDADIIIIYFFIVKNKGFMLSFYKLGYQQGGK
jgi:hypothetical protein